MTTNRKLHAPPTLGRPAHRTRRVPDAPPFTLRPGLTAFRAWARAQLAAGRADAHGWLRRTSSTGGRAPHARGDHA